MTVVEVILSTLLFECLLVGLVMPIEFACEECKSVLRVPDGSSGKRSRCPTCKHEQEIPWVVSEGQEVVASDKLSIPCPKCQNHLVCSPDLLGTLGQCKKCQHIFTISTNPVAAGSAAPTLVFHCPKCHKMFEGKESMRGRSGKCDVCATVFKINLQPASPKAPGQTASAAPQVSQPAPEPATKPTPRRTTTDTAPREKPAAPKVSLPTAPVQPVQTAVSEEDELMIVDEPAPKSRTRQTSAPTLAPIPTPTPQPKPSPKPVTSSAPIRFECSQCRGVMEVPGSTAGLETECPYCQTAQTIPDASTPASPTPTYTSPVYTTPTANYSASTFGSQPAVSQPAAYDPLGGFDLGATNPYAAPTQTWSAPTTNYASSGSAAVTVGNVLQLGFDSLFPSCFMYLLHMLTVMFATGLMYGLFLLVAYSLRGTGEVGLYILGGAGILLLVGIGLMSAWFAGCISRMALNAVRKKPFDFGDAFNPAGAFNSSILVVGGGMLIMLIAYLPMIVHLTTGALRGLEGLSIAWFFLFIPVMILYGFGTSLALFAGADGESSGESLQTSMRLVFKHFGTTLAVLLISGMISGLLAFFTFGVSYMIPIYMTAALYHLAQKRR